MLTLLVSCFCATVAFAADAVPAIDPTIISVVSGILDVAIAKWPSVMAVLTVWGTLSAIYQTIIGAWHTRVAATAGTDDDEFTKKLEGSILFKIFDRIFYFGGYIGTFLGSKGKKTL